MNALKIGSLLASVVLVAALAAPILHQAAQIFA
jgi:hypothetical protein